MDRFNHVTNIAEAPPVRSIAKNRNRLTLNGLTHHSGYDHPVGTSLSWTDCIKQACDHNWQTVLAMIGECKTLINHLAHCIGPPALTGSTEQDIVLLGERRFHALAEHFRSTGHECGTPIT